MAACQNIVSCLSRQHFYAIHACWMPRNLSSSPGFETQPVATSLNMPVFENRRALIMPVHVTRSKICGLSL